MTFAITHYAGEWRCDWCGWTVVTLNLIQSEVPPPEWRRLTIRPVGSATEECLEEDLCAVCVMHARSALMSIRHRRQNYEEIAAQPAKKKRARKARPR